MTGLAGGENQAADSRLKIANTSVYLIFDQMATIHSGSSRSWLGEVALLQAERDRTILRMPCQGSWRTPLLVCATFGRRSDRDRKITSQ